MTNLPETVRRLAEKRPAAPWQRPCVRKLDTAAAETGGSLNPDIGLASS